LEKIIQELKESIVKKNPNSIASLIQATSMTESYQVKREDQAELLSQLQSENIQMKADYEKRLRSLRQQHEKVKLQYEAQVKNLQDNIKAQSLQIGKALTSGGSGSKVVVATAKTMNKSTPINNSRVKYIHISYEYYYYYYY
jgi:hypothetical protein